MLFEIGKCYEHSGTGQMKIVGEAKTTLWGDCLIGEHPMRELSPVGRDEVSATNWSEISEDEWMKNFS